MRKHTEINLISVKSVAKGFHLLLVLLFIRDTGEKPFRCEYCGRGFAQAVHLDQHVTIHTGDRPFSCEVCDKKFVQPSRLQTHHRIHTGEKPFICEICEKAFSQQSDLKKHIGSHHIGEKLHVCVSCGERFNSACKLNIHSESHRLEKPLQSNSCPKTFSCSSRISSEQQLLSQDCDLQMDSLIHREGKTVQKELLVNEPSTSSLIQTHVESASGGNHHKGTFCCESETFKTEKSEKSDTFCLNPFGCGECDELFSSEDDLRVHCSLHSSSLLI